MDHDSKTMLDKLPYLAYMRRFRTHLKYFISSALFLLVSFEVWSQQYPKVPVPDSILVVLDTTKYQSEYLYNTARSMEVAQPELSYSLYYEGIRLAKLGNDTREIMYGHKELGYFFIPISRDSSFHHLKLALTWAERNEDLGQVKSINGSLGTEYHAIGEYALALEHHLRARDYAMEQRDTVDLILFYNRLGSDYGAIGLTDSLTHYFQEAVQLALSIGDSSSASDATGNLAIQYSSLDQKEKAVEYFEKQRSYLKPDQYPRLANYLINYAGVLKKLDRLDESLAALQEAAAIRAHLYPVLLSFLDFQLGSVYLELGQLDQALEANQRSQTIAQQIGYVQLIMQNDYILSKILMALDRSSEALEALDRSIQLAEDRERPESIVEGYDWKAQLCYQLGQYQASADASLKLKAWNDKIQKEATSRLMNEMDFRFQVTQKEDQNRYLTEQAALKEATIAQQRLLILAVVVFLVVVAFLLYRQYKSRLLVENQKGQIEAQSKKLQAMDQYKSRFFANVSHDLRTPLMLMQGNIQMIQYGGGHLSDQDLKSLSKMQMSVDKMTHLTNEISDLILLQDNQLELQLQEVSIGSYFERMVNLFHSAAEVKGISLTWDNQVAPSLKAHIDPQQFEKIVYNLIGNALKFTESGESIHASIQLVDTATLQFEVTDTGQGISKDKVAYIFNRFYQVAEDYKPMGEGMGIGLALVWELVQLHDGEIEVQSEPGEGSSFLVTFPQNLDKPLHEQINYLADSTVDRYLPEDEDSSRVQSVDLKEHVKRTQSAKVVLIVDDHPEIRQYLKELLDDEYIIRMAPNGSEALDLLQKERIDLVITDLMMPLMDGHELIQNMKGDGALSQLPVLVLSARTTSEDLMNVLKKGINDFLAKPFKAEELKQRVRNQLDQAASGSGKMEAMVDKIYWTDVQKELISKVNAAILDRVDDNTFSVQDLSDVLAASTRTTFSTMQKLTGMSPKQYIRSVRFQYAEELMLKKKVGSVTETAAAIGMTNPTHFSNQFEKVIGRKPAAYFDKREVV